MLVHNNNKKMLYGYKNLDIPLFFYFGNPQYTLKNPLLTFFVIFTDNVIFYSNWVSFLVGAFYENITTNKGLNFFF